MNASKEEETIHREVVPEVPKSKEQILEDAPKVEETIKPSSEAPKSEGIAILKDQLLKEQNVEQTKEEKEPVKEGCSYHKIDLLS